MLPDTHNTESGLAFFSDTYHIQITPSISMFDENVSIIAHGFKNHEMITIQAWTQYSWRRKEVLFVSHGHFYADQNGQLDLEKIPSLGGSYKGVNSMGLFWSMAPLSTEQQDARLVIKDVKKPLVVNFAVFPDHIVPTQSTVPTNNASVRPLCIATATRLILAPGVERIEVNVGRVRGTLFIPQGKSQYPGVVDLFGGAGGLIETRAALLASHGFASLSLAYFKYKDLPPKLAHTPMDYFEEAVNWLCNHPAVMPGGIGVVGVSAGGRIALIMGLICPQVKAVVNINGAPFAFNLDVKRHGQIFIKAVNTVNLNDYQTEKGLRLVNSFKVNAESYFPMWQSRAHILCLASEDDQQIPPHLALTLKSLYPPHCRHLIDVIVYPGAGHLLEPPYTPHCFSCFSPGVGMNLVWGGKPKAHAIAQEDSWPRTLKFLHRWLVEDKHHAQAKL